jgi:hypothetical protein
MPSAINERRSRTESVRLMHSTFTVVRPIAVLPASFGPDHRIEQAMHSSRALIQAGKIRTLVRVAAKTSPGQIRDGIRSAMFLRHHVIDLEAQFRHRLRQMAVLAARAGTLSYQTSDARTHAAHLGMN